MMPPAATTFQARVPRRCCFRERRKHGQRSGAFDARTGCASAPGRVIPTHTCKSVSSRQLRRLSGLRSTLAVRGRPIQPEAARHGRLVLQLANAARCSQVPVHTSSVPRVSARRTALQQRAPRTVACAQRSLPQICFRRFCLCRLLRPRHCRWRAPPAAPRARR